MATNDRDLCTYRSKAVYWEACSVPTRSFLEPLEPETTGRKDVSDPLAVFSLSLVRW